MKQKVIITAAVLALLLAIGLIAVDLFRPKPVNTNIYSTNDELENIRKIDTNLVGYTRIGLVKTGMKNLDGLTVDPKGNIFVCGFGKVVCFDPGGNKILEFQTDSIASCIAVNGNDIFLGRGPGLVHYNLSGRELAVWHPYKQGGHITSVFIKDGEVFAADAASKMILKYNLDGNLTGEFGKKDTITGAPGFVIPSMYFDIAPGLFDEIWAANTGRLQMESYSSKGKFVSSWGFASFENSGFAGCCNPAHFAILPDGSFVTYEKGVDKIKVFDPTGSFVCYVGATGTFNGEIDKVSDNRNLVRDIAVGDAGLIYILDAFNQVSVFRKKDAEKK